MTEARSGRGRIFSTLVVGGVFLFLPGAAEGQETATQLRDLAADGETRDTTTAGLVGVVFDSTTNLPLSRARVTILGTPHTVTTDPSGEFRIEPVEPGEYRVRFDHPRLEELAVRVPSSRVRLEAGEVSSLHLDVPSRQTILAAWCEGRGSQGGGVRIGGVVRDRLTGVALPEATVVLRLSRPGGEGPERLEATTDPMGRYRFCGVPGERWATLVTAFRKRETDPEVVRLPRLDALLRNFDLELTEPAQLRGRVVDYESSAPVDGAQVTVEGTDRAAVTDSSGAFALPGVPPGRHVLVTERLGFQTRRDTLTIRGGERLALEIHLPTEPIRLDPLVVEARSREREMPWTVGTRVDGLTTEEIDAMLPRIHSTGDLLAHAKVPGLSVQPRTFREGNTYRDGWCVELARSRRLHRDACAMAEVYVDDVRMNAAEFTLGMIDHQAIRLVQFLSPLEAGAAYGHRARNGVVLIYTRNGTRR